MLEQANQIMEAIINDESLLKNTALLLRKFYEELVEVGFTTEEAARICASYKMT